MMDWSNFLMYLGSGTSKASIYGICSGRWKNDFLFDFWPAGDFGGLELGRAGSVGAVEGWRHFSSRF